MAFGIDNTLADGKKMQSVSEAANVNTARIIGPDGNPVEQKTFGQVITVSSEYYLGDADTYICGATNGQTGQSVVTASTRTSTNSDYQRVSETKETCPSISGSTV
jgi:hypothetical protein